MKSKLAASSPEQRHIDSVAACTRLMNLEVFKHAAVVMLYMPLAMEVDLTPVALRCFQLGKTVCVPKVDWKRRDMAPVEVTSFDDQVMDIDEHGLRAPRDGQVIVPGSIDLAVAPGLAFDTSGARLGAAGGITTVSSRACAAQPQRSGWPMTCRSSRRSPRTTAISASISS